MLILILQTARTAFRRAVLAMNVGLIIIFLRISYFVRKNVLLKKLIF